jgi:hypothetical protein
MRNHHRPWFRPKSGISGPFTFDLPGHFGPRHYTIDDSDKPMTFPPTAQGCPSPDPEPYVFTMTITEQRPWSPFDDMSEEEKARYRASQEESRLAYLVTPEQRCARCVYLKRDHDNEGMAKFPPSGMCAEFVDGAQRCARCNLPRPWHTRELCEKYFGVGRNSPRCCEEFVLAPIACCSSPDVRARTFGTPMSKKEDRQKIVTIEWCASCGSQRFGTYEEVSIEWSAWTEPDLARRWRTDSGSFR